MDIIPWFQPWGYTNGWYQPALDTAALATVAARDATPLITWEAWGTVNGVDPSHLANIPTGAFDAYIDSWAQGLRAFGKPVYLRLFHEMNYQHYPWAIGVNGNTAADLVAAWRYVHDRFTRIGAANVRWVWSPNPDNGVVAYRAIYPGDAYVDWFGLDVYNGGTQFAWGGWLSAEQIAARSYQLMQAINPATPVMLPEVGSIELGGSKAQWITDLYTSLPRAEPMVRAILWFEDRVEIEGQQVDWRVSSSGSAVQAYIAAMAVLP
jgi:Glycosyl hydrolase family 26